MTFSQKDLTYLKGNWASEELDIFVLFQGRCGMNKAHRASVLHEIEPKSKRPKTWKDPINRIPLCNTCHFNIHINGASRFIPMLQRIRMSVENANSAT